MARNKETFQLPAELKSYLDRIGAEVLNFRRAMVKERHRGNSYYVEKTLIKIEPDGTIKSSRSEHNPTNEEREEIKAIFSKIKFPKSVNATKAGFAAFLNKQAPNRRDSFFPLISRKDGHIKMVQERIQKDDGTKDFLPWSFWSDGEWRCMESDGALPFWKPAKKLSNKIMVHEGCKAAAFTDGLINDPSRRKELEAHPWGDKLKQYEHWGMIGGALAPHRSDYSEIWGERPTEVVYVCDNDFPGKMVLQEFSKAYGWALTGVQFDKRFKPSWDMADPMPSQFFSDSGRFIGPKLETFFKPATRATELVHTGEKGRPVAVMKRQFKEEWTHCVQPEVYIHKNFPDQLLTSSEFNNWAAPFSDADDTSRLMKKDAATKSVTLKYDPSRESGIYGDDSGHFVNTHIASPIKAEKGNPKPFIDFMEHLVPEEDDRRELYRWVATIISRPDIKMSYGVLLISEAQGVGKSTLGEKILAPLMGPQNVSYPSENEIVDSAFNYWIAHKRLAVVHEIYAGHSAKAYNRLKSVITEDTIEVNKKYMATYRIANWTHVLACSNSLRAINLSADDRRWFVPKVTEEKKDAKFWIKFNKWLKEEGGLAIIKWWAEDWLKKNAPVLRGSDAPWSKTKGEVVEESYSPGMMLVARVFDRINEELAKPEKERWKAAGGSDARTSAINGSAVLVLDTDLVDLIRNQVYDGRSDGRLEKPLTVRKVAKQKGWYVNPNKVTTIPGWKIVGASARVLSNTTTGAEKPIADLVKDGLKPVDLRALMSL